MRDKPREVRRLGCHMKRLVMDCLNGYRWKMVRPRAGVDPEASTFEARVSVEQPILPTDYVQAKIHNMGLAIERVNNLPVPSRAILSFWHVVGRATARRGFLPGRSLLGGQLRPDYGGGLCQLSGLIYYASLIAGLEILERHPHSRDIYNDQTRYAPLGADATVAYGFKDLRVLNNYSFPVCYRVSVKQDKAACQVCSPKPINECRVEFSVSATGAGQTLVETRRSCGQGGYRVLDVSAYQSLSDKGCEEL